MAKRKPKPSKETSQEPRTPSIDKGDVVKLRLDELDGADTTYCFRANVRVGNLKKSFEGDGQQIPIIVRRQQGKSKYQIISGFRRSKAALHLGWPEIAAIVRNGLSDEEAFRAAVLENTARKTYSDIDRAYIIRAYRDRGHGGDEVAQLMGLTDRQVRNLLSLLELPQTVQAAVDDLEQHFSTTHALTLKKLKGAYAKLDYKKWVKAVNTEELSVAQLKRQVKKEHGGEVSNVFETLFQTKGTDWKKGEVRFAPVKVVIGKMSEGEKEKLKVELERLMGKLS